MRVQLEHKFTCMGSVLAPEYTVPRWPGVDKVGRPAQRLWYTPADRLTSQVFSLAAAHSFAMTGFLHRVDRLTRRVYANSPGSSLRNWLARCL